MTDALPNLYEFLGIERTASQEEILQALRKKTAELSAETDKTPESAQHMQLLGQVYRTLKDPAQRQKYDTTLPPELPTAPEPAAPEAPKAKEGASLQLQRDWRGESEPDEDEDETPDPLVLDIPPEEDIEPTDPIARETWHAWKAAAKEFLERPGRHNSALNAVRVIRPLTIDAGKQVILGYDPRFATLIGHINIGENYNILRRMLCEKLGRSLDLRFVDTTNLDEWKELRRAEVKVLNRITQRVQSTVRATEVISSVDNYAEGVANWEDLDAGDRRMARPAPDPHPARASALSLPATRRHCPCRR